jgi:predicted DNA-binding WGR domain protein
LLAVVEPTLALASKQIYSPSSLPFTKVRAYCGFVSVLRLIVFSHLNKCCCCFFFSRLPREQIPPIMTSRYEFESSKYWEITIEGVTTQVAYGAMGAKPRMSNTTHNSAEEAKTFTARKKIKEKINKGYKEVSSNKEEQVPASNAASLPSDKATQKTGPMEDGENREVQGSGQNPFIVSRRGSVFSCTCPGWKFKKTNIALRTCKHIQEIRGSAVEAERTVNASASIPANGSGLPFASVMLANKYDEGKHGASLSNGEWWMSEKLDGLRAVWDGTKFLSRGGNTFYAPTEFTKDFPSDIILDGELFCGRGNFDVASSLVRSMGGTGRESDVSDL